MVDCRAIEDKAKEPEACEWAVEKLDSDCLDRLSSFREGQYKNARTAREYCKEVLQHKKDKGLCK